VAFARCLIEKLLVDFPEEPNTTQKSLIKRTIDAWREKFQRGWDA